MSVPRRSARQSDEKNHRAEIMETRRSGAHLESSPAKKGIKRDIFARKEGSSLETSKSKLHKSEIKIESSDVALCDLERRQKFQSLLEEVYFRGSLDGSYSPRDESPKTPLLSVCASKNLGRFIESFASAYPSECEDLIVLLDAFCERRYTIDPAFLSC